MGSDSMAHPNRGRTSQEKDNMWTPDWGVSRVIQPDRTPGGLLKVLGTRRDVSSHTPSNFKCSSRFSSCAQGKRVTRGPGGANKWSRLLQQVRRHRARGGLSRVAVPCGRAVWPSSASFPSLVYSWVVWEGLPPSQNRWKLS